MKQQERTGIPKPLLLFLLLIFSHRLINYVSDGIRCLPLHPLSGVGAGC